LPSPAERLPALPDGVFLSQIWGEFGVLEVVWHFLAFLAFFWLFRSCLTFFKKKWLFWLFLAFFGTLKENSNNLKLEKKTNNMTFFFVASFFVVFFSHRKLPAKVPNMHFKFKIYYPQG
jgi:hypothetical protein